MANPLNTFKTKTASLRDSDNTVGAVYNAPTGYTGIILMAQVANVGDSEVGVSLIHRDVGTGTRTPLVQNYKIQPEDAAGLLTGRLIVQENNQVIVYSHRPATGGDIYRYDDKLQLTLSFLESLNG